MPPPLMDNRTMGCQGGFQFGGDMGGSPADLMPDRRFGFNQGSRPLMDALSLRDKLLLEIQVESQGLARNLQQASEWRPFFRTRARSPPRLGCSCVS